MKSYRGKKLSRCGKAARASQNHVHMTGCVSYANKMADIVESTGKQPSQMEFFKFTHTKVGGGFVENTSSSKFMEEANLKVDELVLNSSPSKSRSEIENEVFDELMYLDKDPKRPVGFGAKKSQVLGVHGILRRGVLGSTTVINNSAELDNIKAKMLNVTKENQDIRKENQDIKKDNQELRALFHQNNQILLRTLEAIRTGKILLRTLEAIRTGKVSEEYYDTLQSTLYKSYSEDTSAATSSSRDGLDDLPSSTQPS